MSISCLIVLACSTDRQNYGDNYGDENWTKVSFR